MSVYDVPVELHDVGGVVDDDVEVDLQPEPVRRGDEVGEVLVGAEVRVDRREVEAPVAVVGGAAVLDRVCCFSTGVTQSAVKPRSLIRCRLLGEPLQVAAVVVAGVGRVEAGRRARPGQPAGVVRRRRRSRTGRA